jgi:hypothetical protein
LIAFNKDSNFGDDLADKLQNLLDALSDETFDLDISDPKEYNNVNISELIDILYKYFYQDNASLATLIITKNPNETLNVAIDHIE